MGLTVIAESGRVGQDIYLGPEETPDALIQFPPVSVGDGIEVRRLMDDLQQWTGHSPHGLLTKLGFTSFTITSWQIGKPETEFDIAQRRRLANIHDVVEHIYAAAEHDAKRTVEALVHPPAGGICSASEYLASDRFNEAYLAALDALNPRQVGKLATGRCTPLRARATVALFDED